MGEVSVFLHVCQILMFLSFHLTSCCILYHCRIHEFAILVFVSLQTTFSSRRVSIGLANNGLLKSTTVFWVVNARFGWESLAWTRHGHGTGITNALGKRDIASTVEHVIVHRVGAQLSLCIMTCYALQHRRPWSHYVTGRDFA